MITPQLISYIAPSAPATRRPASGDEPFLRPEVGFTPRWFHTALGIDFDREWHTNPAYRRETIIAMRSELQRRFSHTGISESIPLDLLTGTYGACVVGAIYGLSILYAKDQWPICEHKYLTDVEADRLTPPDLDVNPFFQELMDQAEWIAKNEGRIEGFINWQGVLNNAHRLRGEALFFDLIEHPDRCRRLFSCVCETMIEACKRLQNRQRESGVETGFFTVSNCLVNMVSPAHYHALLLPFDRRIAEEFGCIGIHNCAWNADPYIDDYASIPHLSYIDMGMESDLPRARNLVPHARRAIMYTPMDLANKALRDIKTDLERIAREYGPCDLVFADIDDHTPDRRVLEVLKECETISKTYRKGTYRNP